MTDYGQEMTYEAKQDLQQFFNGPKTLLRKDVSLGLTLSKLICQSFGGDIKVNRELPKGNEMSISFKL